MLASEQTAVYGHFYAGVTHHTEPVVNAPSLYPGSGHDNQSAMAVLPGASSKPLTASTVSAPRANDGNQSAPSSDAVNPGTSGGITDVSELNVGSFSASYDKQASQYQQHYSQHYQHYQQFQEQGQQQIPNAYEQSNPTGNTDIHSATLQNSEIHATHDLVSSTTFTTTSDRPEAHHFHNDHLGLGAGTQSLQQPIGGAGSTSLTSTGTTELSNDPSSATVAAAATTTSTSYAPLSASLQGQTAGHPSSNAQSSSEPSMMQAPQDTYESSGRGADDGEMTDKKDSSKASKPPPLKGNFFARLIGLGSRGKQMHLPDDSNSAFEYDKATGMWLPTDPGERAKILAEAQKTLSGPPTAGFMSSAQPSTASAPTADIAPTFAASVSEPTPTPACMQPPAPVSIPTHNPATVTAPVAPLSAPGAAAPSAPVTMRASARRNRELCTCRIEYRRKASKKRVAVIHYYWNSNLLPFNYFAR